MSLGFHPSKGLDHHALFIDDKGGPFRTHDFFSEHILFLQYIEGLMKLFFLITDQLKGKHVLLFKLIVTFHSVLTDTEDFITQTFQFFIAVSELRGFRLSSRGVVLRVKVEYILLSFQFIPGYISPSCNGQIKDWGGVSFHHFAHVIASFQLFIIS